MGRKPIHANYWRSPSLYLEWMQRSVSSFGPGDSGLTLNRMLSFELACVPRKAVALWWKRNIDNWHLGIRWEVMRTILTRVKRPLRCTLVVLCLLGLANVVRADFTAARLWNEHLLHAISIDTARPTVHARNLFSLSTAMFDTWAAYDPTAAQTMHHEKVLGGGDVTAARNEAISYAAYNVILHRFVTGPAGVGPGKNETQLNIRSQMIDLGYNPDFTSTIGDSPAALGNRIAQSVVNHGLADGANETGNYASPAGMFVPVNPPLTFENPGTVMNDPNRWQPLPFLGKRIDQFGRALHEATE